MHTTTLRKHATWLGGLALLLGTAACHQTDEGLDRRWLLEASADTLDFGTVDLPATSPPRAITLVNTGRKAVALGAMSPEALQVDGSPFALVPQDSSCTTGRVLEPGQGCVLAFTFTPSLDTASTHGIQVSWRSIREREHREETFARTLVLRGEGRVDCAADPAWEAAYEEGRARAEAANETDHARGYAKGQALERDDGYRRGYDSAYSPSYNDAFQQAYDQAWADAWGFGHQDGWHLYADTDGACQLGIDDGMLDGRHAGTEDGRVDGTSHGLEDGDLVGVEEAWYVLKDAEAWGGVFAGCEVAYESVWSAAPAPAPAPAPSGDDGIAGICRDNGFEDHRDAGAYEEGRAEGVAENEDYQAGLLEGTREGQARGRADGLREGEERGTVDGYDAGAQEGRAEAEQLAYDRCYEGAYAAAYAGAYELAYVDHYWPAWDRAHADAWYAVMDRYYADMDCDLVLFGP